VYALHDGEYRHAAGRSPRYWRYQPKVARSAFLSGVDVMNGRYLARDGAAARVCCRSSRSSSYDIHAARLLLTPKRYTPGARSLACAAMIGRIRRRIRFRTTALPIFLLIAYPIWATSGAGSAESTSVWPKGCSGSGAYRTQHQRPCVRRPCFESDANEARDRSGSIRLIVSCDHACGGSKVLGDQPWSTYVGGSRDALSDGARLAEKFSSRFVPIVAIDVLT